MDDVEESVANLVDEISKKIGKSDDSMTLEPFSSNHDTYEETLGEDDNVQQIAFSMADIEDVELSDREDDDDEDEYVPTPRLKRTVPKKKPTSPKKNNKTEETREVENVTLPATKTTTKKKKPPMKVYTVVVKNVKPDLDKFKPKAYEGRGPIQAAKKVFTQIARKECEGEPCEYIFSIQDVKKQTIYTYKGVRFPRKNIKEISRPGKKTYISKYENKVKPYKVVVADSEED